MTKINNFAKVYQAAKEGKTFKLAVAEAQDPAVIEAVLEAQVQGLAEPILVGNPEKIGQILTDLGQDARNFEIIESKSPEESAEKAVRLVSEAKASAVLKGLLPTATLMRAVLNKEYGLRSGSVMSHAMVYEVPGHEGFLINTDGGMFTFPNLDQKKAILSNAADMLAKLGYQEIIAAALAASESVDPKVQASVDAEILAQTDWSKWNMQVFGPVGLDLAISPEAVKHKGFEAKGAGHADIILVPDYLVGNAFGKALTYFAQADSAGLILGATAPIILVSRADSAQVKLNSIALASVVAKNN